MAADSTLAQGAYRASKHYDMGQVAAQRRLSEKLSGLSSDIRDKRKQKEASELANVRQPVKKSTTEKVLADDKIKKEEVDPVVEVKEKQATDAALNNEGVTSGDKDKLYDASVDARQTFINAARNKDTETQRQVKEMQDKMKDSVDTFEQIFSRTNENWLSKGENTAFGYGNALENNPEAKEWLADLISGGEDGIKLIENPVYKDDESDKIIGSEFVVKGPDGKEMTAPQLEEYLSQFEIDNESFNQIDDLAVFYRDEGSKNQKGYFNYDKARKDISQIVSSGNMTSLALDKSFGGTSFADDLFESDELSNVKYSDLGLKPPSGKGDDTITADDNIDDELKNEIIKTMINDPSYKDQLKNTLTEYYTGHMQRNYEADRILDMGYIGPRGTGEGLKFPAYGGKSPLDLINSVE